MYLTRHELFLDVFHNILGADGSLNIGTQMRSLSPSADVIEKDDEWTFYFDLPGVDKKDIDIEIDGNQLVVSGKRENQTKEEEGSYAYAERVYGSFQRRFSLPDNVSPDKISASSENGVLQVHVGKTLRTQPKKIPVEVH